MLTGKGERFQGIDDFKGLARRNPWFAGVMAIFMFSLAGIPPMVGFYAKFAVLQSLVTTNVPGYLVLATVAALFLNWDLVA